MNVTTRALTTLACFALAGCAATPAGAPTTGPATSPATTSAPASASASPSPSGSAAPVDLAAKLSDPNLLKHARWVLGLLEPGAKNPTEADVTQRLAPAALDAAKPADIVTALEQVRAGGPYKLAAASQEGEAAVLRLDAKQPIIVTLAIDDSQKLAQLLFKPDTSGEVPTLAAWPELDKAMVELGGTSQVFVADVAGGTCTPVHTTEKAAPAPSGSMFKLVVLSALVDAVEAGALTWDQQLTLTDDVKSLPSGQLQDRPSGTKVTVREAATLMISVSDNTATDLLLTTIGQAPVEGVVKRTGMAADRVLPLPTTRQVFQLGWGKDQALRDQWKAARDKSVRAAVLAKLPKQLAVEQSSLAEPRWEQGVDWFFTGAELCSVTARLLEQADTPAGQPVREILSKNPGVKPADGVTYQGFKGGSVPGVLGLMFYTEQEGRSRVLVTQTRSAKPVDDMRAISIARGALDFLAKG